MCFQSGVETKETKQKLHFRKWGQCTFELKLTLGTLNAVDFNGGGHFVSGLCSPETKWPPPLKSTTFKVPNIGLYRIGTNLGQESSKSKKYLFYISKFLTTNSMLKVN